MENYILDGSVYSMKPLRSIGIRATQLVYGDDDIQLSLFEDAEQRKRKEKLDATLDGIRQRYGSSSICRACLLGDRQLAKLNLKDDRTVYPYI